MVHERLTIRDLARVSIPTHIQHRDPFAFDRARRARSSQMTLESIEMAFELCLVYSIRHRVNACHLIIE